MILIKDRAIKQLINLVKENGYMVTMNIRRNNTKSKFYLYLKHKFGINEKPLIPKWFYLIRILFYPIETIKWFFEK